MFTFLFFSLFILPSYLIDKALQSTGQKISISMIKRLKCIDISKSDNVVAKGKLCR